MLFEILRPEMHGTDDPWRSAICPGDRPASWLARGIPIYGDDWLHRLAQDAIGQDHDRRPVALSQREGVGHEFDGLGDRGWSQDRDAVVAVAMPLRRLEIVGLRWPDAAQPGPAAHDVDQHHRQLGAGEIAHPLRHEADAGARGRDEDTGTGRRGTQGHVDGTDLALSLDKHAAKLRHSSCHPLQQLSLGRDRIPKVGVAAGLDRRLGHGFVALHQHGTSNGGDHVRPTVFARRR